MSEKASKKGSQGKMNIKEKPEIEEFLREKSVMAFDLMSFGYDELERLPKISPCMNFAVCE